MTALLFTIAVVLGVMTLRWCRSQPTPPMFSADAQARRAGWIITARQRSTEFSRSFFEKLVLVTLVTLVFRHILPGRYSILQVAVGTAAVITATTSISHWLASRGFALRSIGVRFVAMAATNIAIGVAVVSLLASPGTRPSAPTFLFLINLLTLIVVVFDEFQRNQWRAPLPASS